MVRCAPPRQHSALHKYPGAARLQDLARCTSPQAPRLSQEVTPTRELAQHRLQKRRTYPQLVMVQWCGVLFHWRRSLPYFERSHTKARHVLRLQTQLVKCTPNAKQLDDTATAATMPPTILTSTSRTRPYTSQEPRSHTLQFATRIRFRHNNKKPSRDIQPSKNFS